MPLRANFVPALAPQDDLPLREFNIGIAPHRLQIIGGAFFTFESAAKSGSISTSPSSKRSADR